MDQGEVDGVGIYIYVQLHLKSSGFRSQRLGTFALRKLHASVCICESVKVSVTQSCLTLCDPMGYSPRVSFVCGILQV